MKNRVLAAGALVLAVVMPSGSHRTIAATPESAGCAMASLSIRMGTETIAPGTTIGIVGGVQNCSSRKERYAVVVSGTSSCGVTREIASTRANFDAGENVLYAISYPMPNDTCVGPWEVTLQVKDGRDGVTSASTSVMIQ